MTEQEKDNFEKRQRSKQALLKAAEELFTAKGYEAVSTRELAESAGVNLGAIQYHFGSKAKLFVETVQNLMEQSACAHSRVHLECSTKSKREAAKGLCLFIHSYMSHLLRDKGPQPCRLMFREILGGGAAQDPEMMEALVSSVVAKFSIPLCETIASTLKVIASDLTPAELTRSAYSILGQCSAYMTHGPFIERIQGVKVDSSPYFDDSVRHICAFSLRAMGCSQTFVNEVIAEALRAETLESVLVAA